MNKVTVFIILILLRKPSEEIPYINEASVLCYEY